MDFICFFLMFADIPKYESNDYIRIYCNVWYDVDIYWVLKNALKMPN